VRAPTWARLVGGRANGKRKVADRAGRASPSSGSAQMEQSIRSGPWEVHLRQGEGAWVQKVADEPEKVSRKAENGGFGVSVHVLGDLVPLAPVENAPRLLFVHSAPLFEEEGDLLLHTQIADLAYPVCLYGSRPRSRLAAHDSPVDIS